MTPLTAFLTLALTPIATLLARTFRAMEKTFFED